jgi:hypothetical protein
MTNLAVPDAVATDAVRPPPGAAAGTSVEIG